MSEPITTDSPDDTSRPLGRRGLITAAGVTGGVLAALGMAGPRAGAAPSAVDGDYVPLITIAGLRAAIAADDLQLIIDPGQEGLFRAVPGATDRADNNGTVVVTSDGVRYHRVYDGPINVRWFGATGDGETDDTAAIQAAVDTISHESWTNALGNRNNPALYFPAGIYAVSAPIVFDPTLGGVTVFGDGAGSCITPTPGTSTFDALFWADTTRETRAASWTFRSLYLLGRARTDGGGSRTVHGLRGHFTGSTFSDLFIQAFGQDGGGGIAIGYGWSNTIESCRISYCNSGILGISDNLNALNILNTKFSSNKLAAIHFPPGGGGLSIHIRGCSIERSDGPGIVVEGSVGNLDISDCYFEGNGQSASKLPDRPGETANGHIFIGTDRAQAGPIRINDNLVNLTAHQSAAEGAFVICHSAQGSLTLSGNRIENPPAPRHRTVLRLGPSATASYHLRNITIAGTSLQRSGSIDLVDVDQLPGVVNSLHETIIEGIALANYTALPTEFTTVVAGAATTVAATSRQHLAGSVWQLSSAAVGDGETVGFVVDLDDHPELAGRLVYFACTVKASSDLVGVSLWTNQLGHQPAQTGLVGWYTLSYADRMPDSGTVSFGIRGKWTSTDDSVLLARPVLTELGARYDQFPAVSLASVAGLGRSGFLSALDNR